MEVSPNKPGAIHQQIAAGGRVNDADSALGAEVAGGDAPWRVWGSSRMLLSTACCYHPSCVQFCCRFSLPPRKLRISLGSIDKAAQNLLLSLLRNRARSLCKPQRAELACISSFHAFPVFGGAWLAQHSTKQSHEHLEHFLDTRTQCDWPFLAANSLVSPGFGSQGISIPSIAMGCCASKRLVQLPLISADHLLRHAALGQLQMCRSWSQSHSAFTHVLDVK